MPSFRFCKHSQFVQFVIFIAEKKPDFLQQKPAPTHTQSSLANLGRRLKECRTSKSSSMIRKGKGIMTLLNPFPPAFYNQIRNRVIVRMIKNMMDIGFSRGGFSEKVFKIVCRTFLPDQIDFPSSPKT